MINIIILKNIINKIIFISRLIYLKFVNNIEKIAVPDSEVRKFTLNAKSKEILDIKYRTTNLFILQKIFKIIPIKYRQYKANDYDCDDYALDFFRILKNIFPNLPLGFLTLTYKGGSRHAINFFIYSDGDKFRRAFLEPQTGKVMHRIVDLSSYDFMMI